MQIIPVAPQIYRLRFDPERFPNIPKEFEEWGWHSLNELTDCANRYIRGFWNPMSRALWWGSKEAFREITLVEAFALVNGFRPESPGTTGLFWAKPALSWVSINSDTYAADSVPVGSNFNKAINSSRCFVPAAFGIKVMELLGRKIVKVALDHQNPEGRLLGVELGERTSVTLEKSFIRKL